MSRLLAFILIGAAAQAQGVNPGWPQWRGPQRDGTVTTPLPNNWPEKLTKKWELTVGEGHSSPVVSGDRVVIHARQGDNEITRAVALGAGQELWRNAMDLATGKTLWVTQGRDGDNASLLSTTGGEFIVARANPAKFEEIRRYTVADSAMWAHPAIAPRVLLVKDVNKLICWSL
jgi:hypothetical protein